MKSLTQTHIKIGLLALIAIAACFFGLPHHDAGVIGLGLMALSTAAPFPVTPELQAIAIAYRNNKLIADDVLPRKPVGSEAFKYMSYDKGQFLNIIETRVGRKGTPNQVEFTGTEIDSSTNDESLDDLVPNSDITKAASQGLPDPLGQATEGLTDLILLKREQRVATLVHGAGNYAAANKKPLVGNAQWSDYTAGHSDPIEDIVTAMDSCFYRPNVAVMGQAVSTKLRRHPAILKSFNGSLGDTGMVPLQYLAELFELDKILVGQAWANTAKKGQAASLARMWGKHFALIYQDPMASLQRPSPTFGMTAQFGLRVAGAKEDSDIGMRGGQKVRVGESVKEFLMADDLGFLLSDVIA